MERNDGRPLVSRDLVVTDNPDNKLVSERLSLPQGVAVSIVHHVEAAVHVDPDGLPPPPPDPRQPRPGERRREEGEREEQPAEEARHDAAGASEDVHGAASGSHRAPHPTEWWEMDLIWGLTSLVS